MNQKTKTPRLDAIVMQLLKLSRQWNDTADRTDREWYNDSEAYRECAEALSDYAKEVLPVFECAWCRDHWKLQPEEYTFKINELGGHCKDTGLPICEGCADVSVDCESA